MKSPHFEPPLRQFKSVSMPLGGTTNDENSSRLRESYFHISLLKKLGDCNN
jgi:hypothetical protein